MQKIRTRFKKQIKDLVKLCSYQEELMRGVRKNLALFQEGDTEEVVRFEAFTTLLSRHLVNPVVDNQGLRGTPVLVENNPRFSSLFNRVECRSESDVLEADFSRIRAGGPMKAHGG